MTAATQQDTFHNFYDSWGPGAAAFRPRESGRDRQGVGLWVGPQAPSTCPSCRGSTLGPPEVQGCWPRTSHHSLKSGGQLAEPRPTRPAAPSPHLEHLLHPLPRQVHVQLVQQLQDLTDAQAAVPILVRLVKRLLQPLWGRVRVQRIQQGSRAPPPAGRSRGDGPRASALPPLPQRVARQGQGSPAQSGRGGLIAGPLPGPSPRAQGYWSLVRWRRARLSSSLMPAMR